MILFSCLAKTGKDCRMLAGMCVSMAWNVFESVGSLEKPGPNKHVLNRVLGKCLVENFKQNMHLFEPHLDALHVLKLFLLKKQNKIKISHGGHIGFMEGLFPRHPGYMDRFFSQYVDGMFKYGAKPHID